MNEDGLKRARYSEVERRLWNDGRFRALSAIPPCGQGLWLYLLTTPELGVLPGLIVMGESAMAEHLGWTLEAFRKAFREVLTKGMAEADWKSRVVVTFKAIGRQTPQSPNVIKSWRQQWFEVPECELKGKYFSHLKAYVEGLPEAFRKVFAKAIAVPSRNQEQEQEQDQEQKERSEQAAPVAQPPKPKHGTRIPDNWRPSAEDAVAAVMTKFGINQAEVLSELEKFRDYWTGVPGQKGCKLNWDATFRNRLRDQSEHGKIGGHFASNGTNGAEEDPGPWLSAFDADGQRKMREILEREKSERDQVHT